MWRKSWVHQNIRGDEGNGECHKRSLLPDERSVWDDYLDMATPPIAPIAGQICISHDIGYTPEQLSKILKTPVDLILRATARMEAFGMITVENNGTVVINNWKHFQSEYQRQKGYRQGLQDEVTPKGDKVDIDIDIDKKKRVDVEKKYVRTENKDVYDAIFEKWNSKKIIRHKFIPPLACGYINQMLLKGYTRAEILGAIHNYAVILNGQEFFWSHRWTLPEFLKRGVDKFLELDVAKSNYGKKFRNEKDEISDEAEKYVRRNKL